MFGLFTRRLATPMATAASRCTTMLSPVVPAAQCPHLMALPTQAPQISVRHATKKAGGSSNNGRDSAGRRLGIKVWPGTMAKAGGIIVRQRGKKFLVGDNTAMGNDHTIWAKIPGRVMFTRSPKNRKRNIVHVIAEA